MISAFFRMTLAYLIDFRDAILPAQSKRKPPGPFSEVKPWAARDINAAFYGIGSSVAKYRGFVAQPMISTRPRSGMSLILRGARRGNSQMSLKSHIPVFTLMEAGPE